MTSSNTAPESPESSAEAWFGRWSSQLIVTFLIVVLSGAYFAYSCGLPGGFIFDDFPNLAPMGQNGTIDSLADAQAFVLNGSSGPLGRPIALASFLLDDWTWPSEPGRFKHTNILIHLLTGIMLFWCVLLVGRMRLSAGRAQLAAAAATAIWLLHPYWISTVLYPVQRMAMLCALFVFAGVVAYLYGRAQAIAGKRGSYLALTFGYMLFLAAAAFSKENGLLLPLILLALEFCVLRPWSVVPPPPGLVVWQRVFLWLPLVIGTVVLAWKFDSIVLAVYEQRDFTLWERLLSQPRALATYVFQLFVPGALPVSVLQDHFVASRGLFTPLSTALSLFAWLAALVSAFALRKRAPWFLGAVLLFLAAHAMESSLLPLELYFDHRSYLAAGLPLGLLAIGAVSACPSERIAQMATVVLAVCLMLGASLSLKAKLWSDPLVMSVTMALDQPSSVRSQSTAAQLLDEKGEHEQAREFAARALALQPDSLMLSANLALLDCKLGRQDPAPELAHLQTHLKHGDINFYDVVALSQLATQDQTLDCNPAVPGGIRQAIEIALSNPMLQSVNAVEHKLLFLAAETDLRTGRIAHAMQHYERAFSLVWNFDVLMVQATTFATYGYFDQALQVLDGTERQLLEAAEAAQTTEISNAYAQALSNVRGVRAQVLADQAQGRSDTD